MADYKVWIKDEETPEEAEEFNSFDHETAAEEWADWHDRYTAEYRVSSGDILTLCVQEEGSSEIHEYEVTGEMIASYSANFKKVVGGEDNG